MSTSYSWEGKGRYGSFCSVDERLGVQVKLWNPLRTRVIPERFCGGDSLQGGAISSVCTLRLLPIKCRICLQSVLIYKVECLCLFVTDKLGSITVSPHDDTHADQCDSATAVAHYSFALTVCWEVPLWCKLQSAICKTSVHIQPYYKSRQKAEIETENK